MLIKEAGSISEDVEQWPGLVRFPSEFRMLVCVEEPVPEVPLYTDGWKCQLDN